MKKFLALLIFAATLSSCEKYETIKSVDNDPRVNYEAMWNIINDHYVFLDYKGVNWDNIYQQMVPRAEQAKDEFELFDLMTESLAPLRDGHVALISDFNVYGSDYHIDADGNKYPTDYVSGLVASHYLTMDYISRNGYTFGYIERDGRKYAYMNYPSFQKSIEDIDFQYISKFVEGADGIIFDVRENPGGNGQYGLDMAGHFFAEETIVGYSANKAAVGSDELTEPYPFSVIPSLDNNWSKIPTVVLTNRSVFSTGNLFVSAVSHAPNVTLVGGRTGGGAGLPSTYLLPNGWLLCCPSNVLLDINKQSIEDGIAPDFEVHITDEDKANNIDSIVEKAIEVLSSK